MGANEQLKPNERLRRERVLRGWTQGYVASQVGTDGFTVNRWERGRTSPSPYFRQKLCDLFGKNAEELGFIAEAALPENHAEHLFPRVWSIPYRQNPFFTGRTDTLHHLYEILNEKKQAVLTQPHVISGLGGIGKTQTAVEYAYRYHPHYQYVLWVKADSRPILLADFVQLATLLKLPEKDEKDQSRIVAAVKNWLKEHSDWLLILDNVEDLEIANDFIPSMYAGHVLMTTRIQSTGTVARRIELNKMDREAGILFLLHRAKIISQEAGLEQASETDRIKAQELVELLDGLPLALNQAAAYIEETDCGMAGYLIRYQMYRNQLLNFRGKSADHPESVSTTWKLAFEKIQQSNKAAADLLQICAFLHPDAIPEELFIEGMPDLGPELQSVIALDSAMSELRRYSLLRRNPDTSMLTIHRLVQAVLKDRLEPAEQRKWVEQVIITVNRAFPTVEFSTWQRCQLYLPHALECVRLIQQWKIQTLESARLLEQTGKYLLERSSYEQVEQLYQQALHIREQIQGRECVDVAMTLDNLASFYELQWRYEQAEQFYQQAHDIRLRLLGPEHPEVAEGLNRQALLQYKKGCYVLAEQLQQKALQILEQMPGIEHLRLAKSIHMMGVIYREQGKYTQAEPLHQQALTLFEQALGPEHPEVAAALRSLAVLHHEQGTYTQAELLYKRALAIHEKTLGPEHPQVIFNIRSLAILYYDLGRYDEAEEYCKQILTIRKKVFSASHPLIADSLNNLAEVYIAQGKYTSARKLFLQAMTIWEATIGSDHPDMAYSLIGLNAIYQEQGKYDLAEQYIQRALAIVEKTFGTEHKYIAQCLNSKAALRLAQKQYEEAEMLYQQALSILEKVLDQKHPLLAISLQGLADTYEVQEKYELALPLYQKVITIQEESFNPEHPQFLRSREEYGRLTEKLVQQTHVKQSLN